MHQFEDGVGRYYHIQRCSAVVQRGEKVIDSEGKRNFTLKGYGTMLTTSLLGAAA